jgi:lysophospholipase L1-like esterase
MLSRRVALLTPACLLLAAAERPPSIPVAATPISRMETTWWRTRHEEKLAEIKRRPIDLIWLGDSITQDWENTGPEPWNDFAPAWRHFYGDRNALNLGFKGDTTSHLLWRMQNGELDGLHPKAVIILIGANNMGRVHWTARQTVAGIDAVVAETKKRLPGAKILLLSVLPSIRNKYVDRTTAAINADLAARYGHHEVENVSYKDVTALFMKDGAVDRTQFLDDHLTPPDPPLHPTAQAQTHLAETIEPLVAQMLGDKPKTH